ncbi:MAG: prepilin-type N-terminal cleavage/methylation domain-containing protein [Lentisphaeria bacterium]|nr:prepilin-type N-terminal cleavage/methylation domain-containing protein [Lentisphaeria bacterium]
MSRVFPEQSRQAPFRRCGPRGCPRRQGGFTLVEVLVALVIFTLVALVMVSFSREMVRSWEQLRAEHARFHRLLALDRAVDSILSNLVPFDWRDEDGQTVPFFIGDPDYIRLAYLHPVAHADDGALRFLELFAEDGRLVAFYTQRPYLDPDVSIDTARTAVLAEDVDRVSFLYADWEADDAGEWGDRLEWVDTWDVERAEAPLAVLMTVHWRDGRVESWLRRTAGSGFRERWGKWEPAKEG